MNGYRAVEAVWWIFIFAFVAAITYGLTGCAATPVRPVIEISRPVLPEVQADEFRCIDGEKCEQIQMTFEVFKRLRMRDVLLHHYAQELETIICEVAECPR